MNNSSERTAQLLWAELVTVAEAQVTQAGLWPEGEKPERVPQGGGEAGALGIARVTPGRLSVSRAGLLRGLLWSLPLQNRVWPGGQQEHLTKGNGDSSAGECFPPPHWHSSFYSRNNPAPTSIFSDLYS